MDPHNRLEATERSRLAREASLAITDAVARIWHQRPGHNTEFRLDGSTLTLEVSDDIQSQPISLDDRSAGFRWFYSFFILFQAQASGLFKNSVILLDEPGMSLHGKAQSDLVSLMNDLSAKNQIVYTTHSPFMLDPDRLDDVAVVEDRSTGSRVADSIWAVDPDNSFPIQYALGFDIARLGFGLHDQLIVEGASDYWFLDGMRALVLRAKGVDPLAKTATVFAGGAARVMAQAGTSIGQGHGVRVLLDDDTEGRSQRMVLLREKTVPDKSILLTTVDDRSEAAIEDMFGDEPYKRLARAVYAKDLTETSGQLRIPAATAGHPQIARRVESAFGGIGVRFNKVHVARRFAEMARSDTLPSPPSSVDIDRYESFLSRIAELRAFER